MEGHPRSRPHPFVDESRGYWMYRRLSSMLYEGGPDGSAGGVNSRIERNGPLREIQERGRPGQKERAGSKAAGPGPVFNAMIETLLGDLDRRTVYNGTIRTGAGVRAVRRRELVRLIPIVGVRHGRERNRFARRC